MRFKEFKLMESNPVADYIKKGTDAVGLTSSFSVNVPAGRKGTDVADLQKALVALGYQLPKHGVDGINGPETAAAIKQFQQDNQLSGAGVPDQATVAKVNDLLKANPTLAATLKKSTATDVKLGGGMASKIDVSTIQDPDFDKKLSNIANELGVDKKNLIAIMKQESGINPKAVNSSSGATGLIQFMPKTAANLGTTTQDLLNMSAVEQLDYVYKYFKMVGIKPGATLEDLYMAVFMPVAIGKGSDYVLGQAGAPGFPGKVYAQNKGLDRNNDGVITVADATQSVSRFV